MGSATCIKRSLELLTPLYFSDTSDHRVSVGEATQLAMTWSAGLALSVLLGGGLLNPNPNANPSPYPNPYPES